jgi:hypothetical protein
VWHYFNGVLIFNKKTIVKLGGDTNMKRNFLLAIAVTALMVTSTIAQAADVTFGGEFRPRINLDQDSSNNTNTTTIFDTRVRLNAKAKVNANTEVFMQLQSIGEWGVDAGATTDQRGTRQSNGGGADQANDSLSDVGFHQAFITFKNFAGMSADAKIGRQEIIFDGHRLFGNTLWTQGAQSHDAIRLTHTGGNHTVNYAWITANEVTATTNALGDSSSQVHVLHTKTQGVLGGALSGLFTYTADGQTAGANSVASSMGDTMNWYTVGARQAGKLAGLDYRVEYYHQFGDAGTIASQSGYGITGANDSGDSADRDAYMIGARLGKTFANKAGITLWYDYLSGVDDDDQADGDWGAFDTMYDTGHKYYGYMDMYLNRTGAHTNFYGLQDFAIKAKMPINEATTLKADFHHFRTATNLEDGDATSLMASRADAPGEVNSQMDSDLGSEVDITVVHKYDANTVVTLGLSRYLTTQTFSQVNGFGNAGSNANDNANWAYLMVHTKF